MRELTRKMRLQEWARQIDDWQASGMTQRDWCRTHGIGLDAFKYRKAKVEKYASELLQNESHPIVAVNANLMEQERADTRMSSVQTMEIRLEKATVRVSNGIDILLLRSTLEVLTNA